MIGEIISEASPMLLAICVQTPLQVAYPKEAAQIWPLMRSSKKYTTLPS